MGDKVGNDTVTRRAKAPPAGASVIAILGRRTTTEGTGSSEDIWEGPTPDRPLPADAGVMMEVVSTSASDTAAGTGARTVDVVYLDANGTEQETTLTMNGTTAVQFATAIRRVLFMYVRTVGSNTVAVGDISLRAQSGGAVYERISASGNRSTSCHYTVPAGKKLTISDWYTCVDASRVSVRLRATVDAHDFANIRPVFLFQDVLDLTDSAMQMQYAEEFRRVYPELVDIEVRVWGASIGGRISAGFHGLLEDA